MIVETLIQVLSELDSLFVLSISWPMLRRSLAVPMPRRTLAVPLSEPTRYMYDHLDLILLLCLASIFSTISTPA